MRLVDRTFIFSFISKYYSWLFLFVYQQLCRTTFNLYVYIDRQHTLLYYHICLCTESPPGIRMITSSARGCYIIAASACDTKD